MFNANNNEFKKLVMDLSNQIAVFRRVAMSRNQALLDENQRYEEQLANYVGDVSVIEGIHFSYLREEKRHLWYDINSELVYLNVLAKPYHEARERLIELAKKIDQVSDIQDKKAIKDEIKLIVPFIEMYESYNKTLKSMMGALKGYENNNDRYIDFIKANLDTFKDVNDVANNSRSSLKEKKVEVKIDLDDNNITIDGKFDNVKLQNPISMEISKLTEDDLEFFITNFVEGISNSTGIEVDVLNKKEMDLTINDEKIENVTPEIFASTVMAYVLNKKKTKQDLEDELKRKKEEEDKKVPDKPKEEDKPKDDDKKPVIPVGNEEDPSKIPAVVKKTEDGEKEVITLDRILADLTKGLPFEKGDDWKLTASNIKVNENFKRKVCTGNALYNIVALAPSLIGYPLQALYKGVGKIALNKKIDSRITKLKERLNNLTDEELQVIYEHYKGGNLKNYGKSPVVNTLIQQKISSWIKSKTQKISARMIEIYNRILVDFKKMSSIKEQLKNKDLTEDQQNLLIDEYFALVYGKASLIGEYLDLQKQKLNYEVGGQRGFEESIRAYKSGMSQIGFRFRKVNKEDDALNEKQALAYEQEIKGVINGDDILALEGFIRREKLISDNTILQEGYIVDREIGKRSYNPLVDPLNYERDPFVTDLMRTVALVGAGVNLYANLTRAHQMTEIEQVQRQVIEQQQDQISSLDQQLAQARELGNGITDKSGAVIDGRVAQLNEANLAYANTMERALTDKFNWHTTGSEYKAADEVVHATYNQAYNDCQMQINQIADQVASGSLTQGDAMARLSELSRVTEESFLEQYKQAYTIVTEYAKDHPQFDLTAPNESLGNLIDQSANIAAANSAVDDAFSMAREISNLQGLNLADVEAVTANLAKIEQLSSVAPKESMIPGLFGSLSAAALAMGVSTRMGKKREFEIEDIKELDVLSQDIDDDYEFDLGIGRTK